MFISGKLPTTVVIFIYETFGHSVPLQANPQSCARELENLHNAVADSIAGQVRHRVEAEFAH
jgi:hypothetical protein